MSKLRLLLVGACALAAFFAVSGTASALHDPDCDQYGNQFGLYDVSIDTPGSHVARAVSSVSGGGLACGSEIFWQWGGGGGSNSLFFRADIQTAKGVSINPTSGMNQGAYAGSARVDILSYAVWIPVLFSNVAAELSVDQGRVPATDCPVGVVACYKGVTDQFILDGHNWNWVTESGGRYTLTIGRFYNDVTGEDAGLTQIRDFSLCANAGSAGGTECGNASQPWLQKNGDQSRFPTPTCSNGNGVYSVTATTKGGQTTDPVTACVKWFPVARRHL